ncbi:MAG: DUF4198 domain-containing protein [Planctomycetes bacterium]|nr:DUF4198 domain-containing protein [Planctomycetota bacterium]
MIRSATLALALGLPLCPHEVWIEPVLLIHFGDPGKLLTPYKPERILGLLARGAEGQQVPVTPLAIGDTGVIVRPGAAAPALVAVRWESGYRLNKDGKWQQVSAAEALAAGGFRHSQFHAKSILAWHASFSQPVGEPAEVVPLRDPLATGAGALAVQVLADGRPVAGAMWSDDHDPAAGTRTSDADGRLELPLAAGPGTQVFRLKLVTPEGGGELHRYPVLSFTRR